MLIIVSFKNVLRLMFYQYGYMHGRSFLYSWWGGCPTNFGLCPTNFWHCHTKFVEFLMQFVFRMVGILNSLNFEGFTGAKKEKFWLSHENQLASVTFCPTNFFQRAPSLLPMN